MRVLDPHAAAKHARTAQIRLVGLIPNLVEHLLLSSWRLLQVTEHFQNSVADRECGHIDIFFTDSFRPNGVLTSEHSRFRKPIAVFAVLLEGNYSNEDFILHKEAVGRFLEGDKDLKSAELGCPLMAALATFVVKEARLSSL